MTTLGLVGPPHVRYRWRRRPRPAPVRCTSRLGRAAYRRAVPHRPGVPRTPASGYGRSPPRPCPGRSIPPAPPHQRRVAVAPRRPPRSRRPGSTGPAASSPRRGRRPRSAGPVAGRPTGPEPARCQPGGSPDWPRKCPPSGPRNRRSRPGRKPERNVARPHPRPARCRTPGSGRGRAEAARVACAARCPGSQQAASARWRPPRGRPWRSHRHLAAPGHVRRSPVGFAATNSASHCRNSAPRSSRLQAICTTACR